MDTAGEFTGLGLGEEHRAEDRDTDGTADRLDRRQGTGGESDLVVDRGQDEAEQSGYHHAGADARHRHAGSDVPDQERGGIDAVELEPQHGRAGQLDQRPDLQHLAADPVREERATDRAADRGTHREGQVAQSRLTCGEVLADLEKQGQHELCADEPAEEQGDTAEPDGVVEGLRRSLRRAHPALR